MTNKRRRSLEQLQSSTFDVLIIGGGINGAGVLRDLALRSKTLGKPLRLALVEKHQFGSGTSGRNSHLIHGGLRYLKYFDFGLVKEALRERSILTEIAPHLVQPLEFLMPFESTGSSLFYRAGLTLYDQLAGSQAFPRHASLSKTELQAKDPALVDGRFHSGATFWDARVQSARLVLENILEAESNGAVVANYTEVTEQTRDAAGIHRLRLRDRLENIELEASAKILIDATGAWAKTEGLRLVRGSHIIVPHGRRREHAIAYFEKDGRIIFFIPWGESQDLLLIGTTDVDHSASVEDVEISEAEREYLLGIARSVLKDVPDPVASFSSLRPLVKASGRSATSTSREHRIWRDDDNVIRITGGKYTTYRLMSEEAADLVWPESKGGCTTATAPLNNNVRGAIEQLKTQYGEAAPIVFAARHEWAERIEDVIYVSTTWGYERRIPEAELRDYTRVLDEERSRL